MDSGDPQKSCGKCDGVWWWATLMVSVMAVPLVGAVAALTLARNEFMQMAIFVLACWVSTWLGMKLMHKANAFHAKVRDK